MKLMKIVTSLKEIDSGAQHGKILEVNVYFANVFLFCNAQTITSLKIDILYHQIF